MTYNRSVGDMHVKKFKIFFVMNNLDNNYKYKYLTKI